MSEIKVVPYIPDEDYDNPAMVVDFYEFTMANCLFLNGFKDTTLVFDMFFRKNPDDQGYSISAGQRKLTRFLLNYHFNEQDVHWLRTKGMSEEFCEYLRTYRWKGDMYALPEGTVCYPHVQMVRIECDLVGAILIETYLLQTMNFHSLIATKATRITGLNTHTPRSVMEFGTRRAQGESAGNDGAYAAVLGGCIGTANCLAEMKFGSEVKAVGTVAHSFIEFFPTEFDAFKAFADTYPDSVSLLLDTYNIMESGLPNLIKLDDYLIEKYPNDPNRRVKSARIDSGDLARGSKRLRKALDAAGKSYIKLVASNGLDEKKIANMELYEHAHFDSYGVGENLITSASDPVFGGVYKLVAVKRPDGTYQPKMKCSDSASKAIIPARRCRGVSMTKMVRPSATSSQWTARSSRRVSRSRWSTSTPTPSSAPSPSSPPGSSSCWCPTSCTVSWPSSCPPSRRRRPISQSSSPRRLGRASCASRCPISTTST